MLIFRSVPTHEIPRYWEAASAVLAPAIQRWKGRHDEASIFAALCVEDMQLWVAEVDGTVTTAAVTQISQWPRCKECNILLASGEGHELWDEWMGDIKVWALSIGCKFVTCRGRKGWERVLGPAGFRHDGIILSVEI